jgi:hypothetical protein
MAPTANRGTTILGRNLPGSVTGQVGANPDVVNVPVQGKNGLVQQPRLRVRVLPPQQGGGGQGAPAAGVPARGLPEGSVHIDPQTKTPLIVHNGVAVPLTPAEQRAYQAQQNAQRQRQAVAGQQ